MNVPCSKCECTDIEKYTRMKLRKSGKRTKSVASYCILCHYEGQKIREERRYEKKLEYNRKWCKENRIKVNKYKRQDYIKSSRSNWGEMQLENKV